MLKTDFWGKSYGAWTSSWNDYRHDGCYIRHPRRNPSSSEPPPSIHSYRIIMTRSSVSCNHNTLYHIFTFFTLHRFLFGPNFLYTSFWAVVTHCIYATPSSFFESIPDLWTFWYWDGHGRTSVWLIGRLAQRKHETICIVLHLVADFLWNPWMFHMCGSCEDKILSKVVCHHQNWLMCCTSLLEWKLWSDLSILPSEWYDVSNTTIFPLQELYAVIVLAKWNTIKTQWVNANKTRWDYNQTTVLPKFQSLKLSRDQCTTFMQAKTSNIEMG